MSELTGAVLSLVSRSGYWQGYRWLRSTGALHDAVGHGRINIARLRQVAGRVAFTTRCRRGG
jgi:hypothetical protein